MSISQAIVDSIQDNFKDHPEFKSPRRLAKKMGKEPSRVWYLVRGKRSWKADIFMEYLAATGKLQIEQGKIVIQTGLSNDELLKFIPYNQGE